uniref:Putative secreted protein n=1 Tax=Ixodes ricinus TaxID=34613 RepID=A0A6B0U8W5_IXORI
MLCTMLLCLRFLRHTFGNIEFVLIVKDWREEQLRWCEMCAAECAGRGTWYGAMAADTVPYDVTCKACIPSPILQNRLFISGQEEKH